MPTIVLPGNPEITLPIKELSASELSERYKSSIGLFATRAKSWRSASLDNEVATYAGVHVKLHVDREDPDRAAKKSQVKAALEMLAGQSGLALPCALEVFIHARDQACLGYVLPFSDRVKAVLILGRGVTETRSKLVSHAVLDTYGGGAAGKDMQIRTAILHEFGHVHHQLLAPSHYFAIGQLTMLMGKAESELRGEYSARYAMFTSAPSLAEMKGAVVRMRELGARVSEYAGAGTSHPNELVAEVFAGLMMGLTFDSDVMTAYVSMGGPEVPDAVLARSPTPRPRALAVTSRKEASLDELPADIGEGLG